MNWLTFSLDEDYIFGGDGWRLEIPVYGEATIKYRSSDDWEMTELTLLASNGKYGDAAVSWQETINPASVLFMIVAEYLQTKQRERVEEMIREDQRAEYESRLFDEGKERAKLRGTGAVI